jgi:hypothetical protein
LLALNEPRELYLHNSFFDIWSKRASESFQADADYFANADSIFNAPSPIYIEKMPEHILRWRSLTTNKANSKLIYVYRDWYEVAKSIENSFGGYSQNWYGFNSVKWLALSNKVCKVFSLSEEVLRNITDLFVRGVVEWILCNHSYEEAKRECPGRVMMVRYAELIESKESFERTMEQVGEFLELEKHLFNYGKIKKPRNKSEGGHIEALKSDDNTNSDLIKIKT